MPEPEVSGASNPTAEVDVWAPTFAEASLATVTRVDEQLRGLALGSAPLPTSVPWEQNDAR